MHLSISRLGAVAVAVGLIAVTAVPAQAQANNPCLGELMLFGGNYCPQGYAEAAGQTLSISQNSALFSLYGTMYGGNGQTTFGLPDLRGRAPIGQGQGPGLPNYSQGQTTGSPASTITIQNMSSHSHTVNAVRGNTDQSIPSGQLLGIPASGAIYSNSPANVTMSPAMIGQTGGNQPLTTQSPIQAIRWCVAVQGIYCSRP